MSWRRFEEALETNKSSNINEVIKTVLNFFFDDKVLHAQKVQKEYKAPKSTKSIKTQPSKSTKTQISKQK